jgi:hypothetical protein
MGNFSRNTFNPDKNYVGVRLQQGVPLVDADWNELNDVIRQELYDGLSLAISDGVLPGDSLKTELVAPPHQAPNNLKMLPGLALIGGRPLRVWAPIIYTDQPWFNNPTRAAQDGVAVIPPLTQSGSLSGRTDLVYLDVWDREIKSTEDANLINPTIGIETCVRLKREVALRVVQGVDSPGTSGPPPALPPAPDGHFFMPLAHLVLGGGPIRSIDDIRPKVGPRGIRSVSFTPAFQPVSGFSPWTLSSGSHAQSPLGGLVTLGMLPLGLPDGANLLSLHVIGETGGTLTFILIRRSLTVGSPGFFEEIVAHILQPTGGASVLKFNSSFAVPTEGRKNIVDNSLFHYTLRASSSGVSSSGGAATISSIYGISIRYQY